MGLSYFFNGAPQTLQLLNNVDGSLLPGAIGYGLDSESHPKTASYGAT